MSSSTPAIVIDPAMPLACLIMCPNIISNILSYYCLDIAGFTTILKHVLGRRGDDDQVNRSLMTAAHMYSIEMRRSIGIKYDFRAHFSVESSMLIGDICDVIRASNSVQHHSIFHDKVKIYDGTLGGDTRCVVDTFKRLQIAPDISRYPQLKDLTVKHWRPEYAAAALERLTITAINPPCLDAMKKFPQTLEHLKFTYSASDDIESLLNKIPAALPGLKTISIVNSDSMIAVPIWHDMTVLMRNMSAGPVPADKVMFEPKIYACLHRDSLTKFRNLLHIEFLRGRFNIIVKRSGADGTFVPQVVIKTNIVSFESCTSKSIYHIKVDRNYNSSSRALSLFATPPNCSSLTVLKLSDCDDFRAPEGNVDTAPAFPALRALSCENTPLFNLIMSLGAPELRELSIKDSRPHFRSDSRMHCPPIINLHLTRLKLRGVDTMKTAIICPNLEFLKISTIYSTFYDRITEIKSLQNMMAPCMWAVLQNTKYNIFRRSPWYRSCPSAARMLVNANNLEFNICMLCRCAVTTCGCNSPNRYTNWYSFYDSRLYDIIATIGAPMMLYRSINISNEEYDALNSKYMSGT